MFNAAQYESAPWSKVEARQAEPLQLSAHGQMTRHAESSWLVPAPSNLNNDTIGSSSMARQMQKVPTML
jgi:hypothetical protein